MGKVGKCPQCTDFHLHQVFKLSAINCVFRVVLSNDPETITLRILDNQTFDVQVKVLSESQHFLGEEREAKNIERFVKYTINGVPGKNLHTL